MSAKLYFPTAVVLILFLLASGGYCGNARVDFDDKEDSNYNGPSTEPNWVCMVIEDVCDKGALVSGDIVNGIQIDFYGNINDRRRGGPNDICAPPFPEFQINEEQIHRDFIFGIGPKESVNIDLWGLGAGQKCDIHIWAFDDESHTLRVANWKANGEELLTTEFKGGDTSKWPRDIDPGYEHYDFNGIGHADEDGHIYLTSKRDPGSDKWALFCFVNALEVYPIGTPNDINRAHRLMPLDGTEDVPIDTELSWRPGDKAVVFDVYLGLDPCSLTLLDTVGSNSIDPYGANFLAMGKTYYWRVDANDGAGNVYTGEVASFTTRYHWVVDDFESYVTTDDLRDVWCDYWGECGNNTCATVYVAKASDSYPALDEKSMEYTYENYSYEPYYSEAWVNLSDLGVDTNFAGMDVKSLSIWFYGDVSNPVSEKMYVKLTDGDSKSATVTYPDMNDLMVEDWQEWNISMQEFPDNNDIDMTDIVRITIGFGDGTQAVSDGKVYFDDIRLYTTRCVLSKRSADFTRVDYAPLYSGGDCVVDYQELEIMIDHWLYAPIYMTDPGTDGLVAYYPFDDFNEVFTVHGVILPSPPVTATRNMAPNIPHPNAMWAILSPIDPCSGNEAPVEIIRPGVGAIIDILPDGNCLKFDQDAGTTGERVHCGRWNPIGNWSVGGWDKIVGEWTYIYGDANSNGIYANTGDLTLSVWIKWAGPHTLRLKSQGIISKRGGWGKGKVNWMFECDTVDYPRGSFSLRQFHGPYCCYSPANILNQFIGQWIHLAATYHGSAEPDINTARLYLNGAEVASGPFYFGGPANPNEITMTIGNNAQIEHQDVENFLGELDEVHIYNRALEPNEIAYLAATEHSFDPPTPPPPDIFPGPPWTVNFSDFAVMANYWLAEDMWP